MHRVLHPQFQKYITNFYFQGTCMSLASGLLWLSKTADGRTLDKTVHVYMACATGDSMNSNDLKLTLLINIKVALHFVIFTSLWLVVKPLRLHKMSPVNPSAPKTHSMSRPISVSNHINPRLSFMCCIWTAVCLDCACGHGTIMSSHYHPGIFVH